TFNETLLNEIEQSGIFRMAPKTSYPLQVPQQPQDFRPSPPPAPAAPVRRGQAPPPQQPTGPTLNAWAGPPVNANYLAFGYTAERSGTLALFGSLFNVNQPDVSNAQV